MAQQQISFDFFANEPEVKASEKKSVVKKGDNNAVQTEIPQVELTAPAEITVDETVREVNVMTAPVKEVKEVTAKPEDKKSTRGRMKLADMDATVDLVEVPEDELLFQKRYYGIGEVSDMFKVNVSLIRFWENEFAILKPKKNGKGDRLFRPEDVKSLQLIHHLLREKKYSIAGAKDFLKKNKQNEESFALIETLKKTKAFLLELKANL
jgi:DNA-binding transcriptional MerR regulator